jgi:hypothetical protein
VDYKDDARFCEISFDFLPLAVTQRRAEIVRSDAQVEFVNTIELALRVSQRRE